VLIDGEEPESLTTFINDIRSLVGGIVDALGFELGVPLRYEPTHAIKDGQGVSFIQPGWPDLRDTTASENDEWVHEDNLGPLIQASVTTPLIRYAIADAQRAIELPDDTAFYCYRAIESLRLLFLVGDEDRGRARADSWGSLRSELNLERPELEAIKKLADKRRHGGPVLLSEEDRRQCLLVARRTIRLAVERYATS
jgi:hypothetical protein